MSYLEALETELAYCIQNGKSAARIAAVRAEIARESGNAIESTSVDPVAETTDAPKAPKRRIGGR